MTRDSIKFLPLLAGVGGTLLAVVMVVGVSLWLLDKVAEELIGKPLARGILEDGLLPAVVVLDFSILLEIHNFEEVYCLTTQEFKQTYTPEALADFARNHPFFGSQAPGMKMVEQTGERMTYEIESQDLEKPWKYHIRLQKEQGTWKIADLVLPEEPCQCP